MTRRRKKESKEIKNSLLTGKYIKVFMITVNSLSSIVSLNE